MHVNLHQRKTVRDRLRFMLWLLPITSASSYGSSIYTMASTDNSTDNHQCSDVSTCAYTVSGFVGGGQYTADQGAGASATFGDLHAYANAAFEYLTAPNVTNIITSTASGGVTTSDTFHPSVLSGTLEYQFTLDGSIFQNTPGCTACNVEAILFLSWSDATLNGKSSQTVIQVSGNVGSVSRSATFDIPYSTDPVTGVTVQLEFVTEVAIEGFSQTSPGAYSGSSAFQNTLSIDGVGILGQPNSSLNPTSGYQYPALNSVPEPSTLLPTSVGLMLAGIGLYRRERRAAGREN